MNAHIHPVSPDECAYSSGCEIDLGVATAADELAVTNEAHKTGSGHPDGLDPVASRRER
jgi:hypothetical protein